MFGCCLAPRRATSLRLKTLGRAVTLLLTPVVIASCGRAGSHQAATADSAPEAQISFGALDGALSIGPGESSTVTLPVNNGGQVDVAVAMLSLSATRPAVTLEPLAGNPGVIAAGATVLWTFETRVASGTPVGPAPVHATLWFSGEAEGLTKLESAEAVGTLVVRSGPRVARVTASLSSPSTTALPGGSYVLNLSVSNLDAGVLTVHQDEVGFAYESAGIDMSPSFITSVVQGSEGLEPIDVQPGETRVMPYNVATPAVALGQLLVVTAEIGLSDTEGPLPAVNASWIWSQSASEDVWITVVADEDDTGATPTVTSAGGVNDMSLREALLIANNRAGASRIRFDGSTFPPAPAETVLVLDPALGPLPSLSAPELWLDGGGSQVEIVSAVDQNAALIRVTADSVVVSDVALSQLGQPCVVIESGDGSIVRGLLARKCYGGFVRVDTGRNHQVRGNDFRAVVKHLGYSADYAPLIDVLASSEQVQIVDNGVSFGNGCGIRFQGVGHTAERNFATQNRVSGICALDGANIAIRNNVLIRNGHRYPRENVGVSLKGNMIEVLVTENRFEDNDDGGIYVATGVERAVLRRNQFGSHAGVLHELAAGANVGAQAPTITAVSASQVAGTFNVDGAVIEVYDASGDVSWLGDAIVVGGQWVLEGLTTPPTKVVATATSSGGTGPFSSLTLIATAPLVVSTTADELDGTGDLMRVAEAGGPGDLSLREAMHIAENRQGPDTITFDPSVFSVATPGIISFTPSPQGLGVLPNVLDGGLTIDGSGAGVVLDGGMQLFTSGDGLYIGAPLVTVRNIAIRDFLGVGAQVRVHVAAAGFLGDGLSVACGGAAGIGIRVHGNSNLLFQDIEVARCAIGMDVGTAVGDVAIIGARLHDMSVRCLAMAAVTGGTLLNSELFDCGEDAVLATDTVSVDIIGNEIRGSTRGVACSRSRPPDVAPWVPLLVAFNTIAGTGSAIHLANDASAAGIHNNILAHSRDFGIAQAGTPWTASYNLFYDNGGDGTAGTNAIQGIVPSSIDASNLLIDPQLADLAAGDLRANSGVIDQGVDLGIDRNGRLVPGNFDGVAPDIGAVEQQ